MKVLPRLLTVAAALPLWASLSASVADNFPVPALDYNGVHGAVMPYTRYDCNEAGDATFSNGASLKTSPNWDPANKASQASNQAYVDLPVGASVSWRAKSQGDGLTVRFTIKDSHVGKAGQEKGYAEKEGHLEFYVNGQKAGDVDLTSYYMYQYFSFGSGSPSQSSGDAPCFCFDERHLRLSKMVNSGDEITVKCTAGQEVGVDFLELEVVPDPLDPEDEANGRQIFNVTAYGAKPDVPSFDNRDAFVKAFNAANAKGGIVFVPEGTWYMGHNGQGGHGMLSLHGKNVKVMGAGIWHTNIQFTGWEQFGGGVSGGNPSNTGGYNDMDNIEWCHMYFNSNLADRHGENAVYKCFMDIWCNGSVIHDIWEQHFECGLWFGDYNSNVKRASEVKVYNCRIRDNYADGVNFCEGTSNSTVFNCSVRNNGDDGLACWDSPQAGIVEQNNTFCYNTIDFIWRAGAIAIYGGEHQRAYNNYIVDTFMASGIHCNDIFSRGKMSDVVIENNVLVRCGTLAESWGRDYGAIDCEGNNTAVFKNNYLYDCPAEAIRLKGSADVKIDGLYVNGAGLSGGEVHYSASPHSVGLANIDKGLGGNITNFYVVEGSVPAPTEGANLDQYKTWPFWDYDPRTDNPDAMKEVTEDEADAAGWFECPDYPLPEGVDPPVNPFETLKDYNFTLTGIDWITGQNKHSMYEDDEVTFSVRVDYKGNQRIEAGTKIAIKFSVDGKSNFSYTVKDGFEPNSSKIITFPAPWTATLGEHTFSATIDPSGKLLYESNRADNTRVKAVNVKEIPEGEEPEIEIVPTGVDRDLAVVKVWFENETTGDNNEFSVGDRLSLHARIANTGNTTLTLGPGKGVLWALSPSIEYVSGMAWDDATHALAPGEYIDVTPNGGGNLGLQNLNADCTYTVAEENVTLYCRLDNPAKHPDNNADNNNNFSKAYEFPTVHPVYNENPDKADKLQQPGQFWDYEDENNTDPVVPVVKGFNPAVTAIYWTPGDKEVNAGQILSSFSVDVVNNSEVELPEGTDVKVTLYVDNRQLGQPAVYSYGLEAGEKINVTIDDVNYVATAGAHTVKAVIASVRYESTTADNNRERTFNAKGSQSEVEAPAYEYLTGFSTDRVNGLSCVITKIRLVPAATYDHSYKLTDTPAGAPDYAAAYVINPGDRVNIVGTVYNNGTQPTMVEKHGFLVETMPSYDPKYWSDDWNPDKDYFTVLQPGESIDLVTCGGTNSNGGVLTMPSSKTTYRVLFDDQNDMGIKEKANATIYSLNIEPKQQTVISYHPTPTGDDTPDVNTGIESVATEPAVTPADDVWYNLQGIRVACPTVPGFYIHNGKKVLVR